MDIHKAFKIYNLSPPVTVDQLEKRHRELILKYHPDRVPKHSQWCHRRIMEIQEAKDLLLENPNLLERGILSNYHLIELEKNQDSVDESIPHEGFADHDILTLVQEQLECFYQYGLEKSELRQEGVRRFRFRRIQRTMKNFYESNPVNNDSNYLSRILVRLAKSFYFYSKYPMNTGIIPGPNHIKKAHMTMKDAARGSDASISRFFLQQNFNSKDLQTIYSCLKVLIMLRATYKHLAWTESFQYHIEWLESFLEYLEILS